MMSVVIHHPHAIHLALQLETAIHATESFQRIRSVGDRNVETHAHGNRRGRI